MGYYHLQVHHGVARSAGAHYDYIHRLGHYKKRRDLQCSEHGNLPPWADESHRFFWESADRYERFKGRPYKGLEAGLSAELTPSQRIALVREFVDHLLADRHAYSWAIHAPDPDGVGPHPHVHLMFSERIRDGVYRGPRTYFASPLIKDPERRGSGKERHLNSKTHVYQIRSAWADVANDFFERQGIDERIDERSHRQRGLILEPKRFEDYGESGQDALGRARREFNRGRVARNVERLFIKPELALQQITAEKTVFTRLDIEHLVRRLTTTRMQYTGVLMKVLTLPELIDLPPTENGRLPRFSTRALQDLGPQLTAEATWLASLPAQAQAQAEAERASTGPTLEQAFTPEQEAALGLMTSARRLATLSGPPGSGRSTVLRTAHQVLAAQGRVVLGAAPGEGAAAALQRETGIESVSLSTLLRHVEHGKMPHDPALVLVVEDAGLLGLRTLKTLVDHVRQHRGRLRLVAETGQLGTARAAEGFGRVEAAASVAGAAARLTAPVRQRADWQRTAARAVSGEALAESLETYAKRGHVQAFADEATATEGLLARWARDRADHPDETQLLLVVTEEQRRRMNRAARALLRQSGALAAGVALHQKGHFIEVAPGERLRLTRSRHSEGIEAGMLGQLVALEGNGWRVRLDNGRTHTLPPDLQNATDHGYASSIARAQGITVDRAYLMASPGLDAAATAVALTRHRRSLHIGYSLAAFREPAELFSAMTQDPRLRQADRVRDRPPDATAPAPAGAVPRTQLERDADARAVSRRQEERLERWQDARSDLLRRSPAHQRPVDPRVERPREHERDRDPEIDP